MWLTPNRLRDTLPGQPQRRASSDRGQQALTRHLAEQGPRLFPFALGDRDRTAAEEDGPSPCGAVPDDGGVSGVPGEIQDRARTVLGQRRGEWVVRVQDRGPRRTDGPDGGPLCD